MTYTVEALLGIGAALLLDLLVFRTRLVAGRVFWLTYVIVVAAQLATNGVLTGARVVVYSPATILGPRVVFAPIEDLGFGFALVLVTLSVWVWLGRRGLDPA
jgi:lycopene cyclase domain-containing protein